MDPAKITKFEKEFLQHIKTTEQALLNQIAQEGQISPASDAKLKEVVTKYLATFNA